MVILIVFLFIKIEIKVLQFDRHPILLMEPHLFLLINRIKINLLHYLLLTILGKFRYNGSYNILEKDLFIKFKWFN